MHRFAEHAWLLQFNQQIDEALNDYVICLGQFLVEQVGSSFEVIPAYCSLLLVQSPDKDARGMPSSAELTSLVNQFQYEQHMQESYPAIEIPVCYDEALGNDLRMMADILQRDANEIVNLHVAREYHVYMIGFLPGFAYMGSVDPRIACDRKSRPVPTKSGAVGIAGMQTGIYPTDSPGGWHIVGYTPTTMFDVNSNTPSLLRPGNRVRFVPVNINEYNTMCTP